jgi:hypothetical protein
MSAESDKIERTPKNAKLGRRLNNIDRIVLLLAICVAVAVNYSSPDPIYLAAVEGAAECIVVFAFYFFTVRRLLAIRWPERFEWKCSDCGGVVASTALLEEAPVCRHCNVAVLVPPVPGKSEKVIKRAIFALVVVIVGGLILFWQFKNFSEEQDAKTFLRRLGNHEYQQAYAMFGCTEKQPCAGYALSRFMEDWGPKSPFTDPSKAKIGLSQSCGDGVLLRLDYPNAEPVMLIVDRKTDVISFAPPGWVECPGRHWHFGRFIKSLFNK